MKRKRALLESNSPRNSQLETHRSDEPGGPPGPLLKLLPRSRFPHRNDRSPYALKTQPIGPIDLPMP
jgi:hypothetical protein